jgi:hypothetical protein
MQIEIINQLTLDLASAFILYLTLLMRPSSHLRKVHMIEAILL